MPEPVRIIGGKVRENSVEVSNDHIQAQVDTSHNLQVREGTINSANVVFEDTSFVTGDSPQVHDFYAAIGRNSYDGYIVCDGDGSIKVEVSRDGLNYDGQWTLKKGEITNLCHMTVSKIRVTWTADSSYRINLI